MKVSRAIPTVAVAGLCVMQTACSSIKSKIYDSDNYTTDGRQVKCLKGIPETVDVPTHIKITVTESRYFKGPALKSDGTGAAVPISAPDNLPLSAAAEADNIQNAIATLTFKGSNAEDANKTSQKTLDALVRQLGELTGGKAPKDLVGKPDDNSAQVNELLKKIAELQIQIATTADTTTADAATIVRLKDELKKVKDQLAKEAKYAAAEQVHPTRSMGYEVLTKKELFTVDFKRPASGVGDLKLTYGKASGGQFFESVKQDVTDTTIQDVGNLVSQVASVLPKLKAIADDEARADANRAKLGLHVVSTVVAIEYFDVHQPNLEARIQEFLDRNVNACSPPCGVSGRPAKDAVFPVQNVDNNPVPAAATPTAYRGPVTR